MQGKNVQGNLWVKESLFFSITKVLAIYIHLRQTLIGRSLAGSSSLQQQLLQWMFHIPILVHLLIGSRIACYKSGALVPDSHKLVLLLRDKHAFLPSIFNFFLII